MIGNPKKRVLSFLDQTPAPKTDPRYLKLKLNVPELLINATRERGGLGPFFFSLFAN